MPDISGNVTEPNDLSFREIGKNSQVRVSRVIFESDEVLRYLQSYSITPGADLVVGDDGGVYFGDEGARSRIPEDIAAAMKFFPR